MVVKKRNQDQYESLREVKNSKENLSYISNKTSFSLLSMQIPSVTLNKSRKLTSIKKEVNKEYQNKIFVHDCRDMIHLPDNSVELMITSPPYNTTKKYDENLTLKEYLQFIEIVLKEVFRVLKSGGIIALNIANVGRKPYLPLDCFIIQILQKIGYWIFDEIIWNKAASSGGSCAWGSWKSATNPSLRDVHEYIILATKSGENADLSLPFDIIDDLPSKLENRKFSLPLNEFFSNIWEFNSESAKRVNHPAPFPVELPYRIILMFSKRGDLILDPFIGSGSVAIAALIAGRNYVGYDIKQEYVDLANERIENYLRINNKRDK